MHNHCGKGGGLVKAGAIETVKLKQPPVLCITKNDVADVKSGHVRIAFLSKSCIGFVIKRRFTCHRTSDRNGTAARRLYDE